MLNFLKGKEKGIAVPSTLTTKSKAVKIDESDVTFVNNGTNEIVCSAAPFEGDLVHSVLRYFEVAIKSVHPKGCIAVGITTSSFKEGNLPGWVSLSYGYHGDDGKVFGAEHHAEGKPFYNSFGAGDVVGCGINVRKELFFTLNGKYIGVAFTDIPNEEWYPTVGADYEANVSVNLGTAPFMLSEPWKYAFSTAPLPSAPTPTSFSSIPEDIVATILEYAIFPVPGVKSELQLSNVLNLSRVSKQFNRLLIGSKDNVSKMGSVNKIWRNLTVARWVFVSESNVHNWYKFYKRRDLAVKNKRKDLVVDNCMEWEFKCPISIENLDRTLDSKIDHCSLCNRDVYICSDIEELKVNVQRGHCVMYDRGGKETKSREELEVPLIMGRMVPHRNWEISDF